MNQQRARRFRSAQEASAAAEAAAQRGEEVSEDRFDSNCITPGTEFMARLSRHLDYYIHKRLAEEESWKGMQVILSGHEVPGEGEHKIMEYIRLQKLQPNYPPNTTHCLYGLDADLIMLGLVTHEPHFCLLREVVQFTGGGRGRPARDVIAKPSAEGFILLQLGLLREYLDLEFRSVPFSGYNFERVIDDFVFIAYLVGNDFLPTLPTLDIAEGALDSLFKIYKDMNAEGNAYLTNNGTIDIANLQTFFTKIGEMEYCTLRARAREAQSLQDKKNRRRLSNMQLDELDASAVSLSEEEGAVMMSSDARALMLDEDADVEAAMNAWKHRYYVQKAGLSSTRPTDVGAMSFHYVRGLHWVIEYYYKGVASWDWYYPFHYAPCASDLAWGVQAWAAAPAHMTSFSYGRPFSPFEQLLSVLPPASSRLLPEPYRKLMHEPSSPINDFYPSEIGIDLEGKRNDWEGVILIPFIDEKRLLDAAATVLPSSLTPTEQSRNYVGAILVYTSDENSVEVTVPSTLPKLMGAANGRVSRIAFSPPPPLAPNMPGFTANLTPGTKVGAASPNGFPSFKTLPCTGSLEYARVNVFGTNSKKESLILHLKDLSGLSIRARDVAGSVLGKRCFVQWPYLKEAQVVSVSDISEKIDACKPTEVGTAPKDWSETASSVKTDFLEKSGVDIGDVSVMLHVKLCTGLVQNLDGSTEKRFAPSEENYPLQAVLQKAPSKAPGIKSATAIAAKTIRPNSKVLFVGSSHFGSLATVLPKVEGQLAGFRVSINLYPGESAIGGAAKRILGGISTPFLPSYHCAKRLRCTPRALGALTGSLRIKMDDGIVDVGLNLKNKAHKLHVPDYARPAPNKDGSEGNGDAGWQYSQSTLRVLEQYRSLFPLVFAIAEQDSESPIRKVSEVLPELEPGDAAIMLHSAKKWLASQPMSKRPLVSMDSKQASEEGIRALEAATPPSRVQSPTLELEGVQPSILMPPQGSPDVKWSLAGGEFRIGDRIAFLGPISHGNPPFGARGCVVGVHEGMLEVLFDSPFSGASDLHGRCATKRGKVVPLDSVLNITKPPVAVGTLSRKDATSDTVIQRRPGAITKPKDRPAYASAVVSKADVTSSKLVQKKVHIAGPVLRSAQGPESDSKPCPDQGKLAGQQLLKILQRPVDSSDASIQPPIDASDTNEKVSVANAAAKTKKTKKSKKVSTEESDGTATNVEGLTKTFQELGKVDETLPTDEDESSKPGNDMAELWMKLSSEHARIRKEQMRPPPSSIEGSAPKNRKKKTTKKGGSTSASNSDGTASKRTEEINYWNLLEGK